MTPRAKSAIVLVSDFSLFALSDCIQMASKRSRVTAKAQTVQPPSDSLITEVFDTLAQANRKQLLKLLSVLVKASSASALEQVKAEAVKCGALIKTHSRFQQCNHSMLDSFFSLLDYRSLQAAETVCRRWRYACIDSGAGWKSVLGFETFTDSKEHGAFDCSKWQSELRRHHLSVAQVRSMRFATIQSSFDVQLFSQLTSLNKLFILPFDAAGAIESKTLHALMSVPNLQQIECDNAVDSVLPSLLCCTNLTTFEYRSAKVATEQLKVLAPLTKLRQLRLRAPFATDLAFLSTQNGFTALLALTFDCKTTIFTELSPLFNLPSLQYLVFTAERNIQQIAELTKLKMLALTSEVDRDSGLQPLAKLTNLTYLQLTLKPAFRLASELTFLSNLTSLATLNLDFYGLPNCAPLTHLTNLQSLRLGPYVGSLPDLSAPTKLTKLEELAFGMAEVPRQALLIHTAEIRRVMKGLRVSVLTFDGKRIKIA